MTPYYEHGGITIYHGNSQEILPTLPISDMVLTDPPWNLNVFHDDAKPWADYAMWLFAVRVMCERASRGPVWIFQSTKAVPYVAHVFPDWQMFASVKTFCQMTPKRLPNAFDVAFVSNSVGYRGNGRNWHIGKNNLRANAGTGHPTSRPLDTIAYIIAMHDARTIYDPFCGAGTTLVAAKEQHRCAIGIEIEERYCEIAAKRLQQEVLPLEYVS